MEALIPALIGVVVGAALASFGRIAEAVMIGSLEDRRRLRGLLQRVLVEARRNRSTIALIVVPMQGRSSEAAYKNLQTILSMERMVRLDAWSDFEGTPLLSNAKVMRVLELGAEVSAFVLNIEDLAKPPDDVSMLPPLEMILPDESLRRMGRQPWTEERKVQWKKSEPWMQERLNAYGQLTHTDYLKKELRQLDDFVEAVEEALVSAQPWLLRRQARRGIQASLPLYGTQAVSEPDGEPDVGRES